MLPVVLGNVLTGQAADIELHLAADSQSRQLESISLDDPRLGQPTPVMDEAKAALGWHFADFSGTVEGYVQDAKIGKDLLPVDNTLIHASPSSDSRVLSVYRFGDDLEVVDTGVWWKIRFTGTFPVYFVLDTPPPLPAVTGTADVVAAPAPVIETAPVAAAQAPAIVSTVPLPSDEMEAPRPGAIGQRYDGIFRRSKKRFGLLKPRSPYFLEDASGDRIAWLDVSEIVLPGPINAFLDEPVVIHGERSRIKSDWMIHARNMRLK